MSSRYVPYELGCSYDTMAFTMRNNSSYLSKTLKIALVRIVA